jgi:hypothetical protein
MGRRGVNMKIRDAIEQLQINRPYSYTELRNAVDIAIKALEMQELIKDNIEYLKDKNCFMTDNKGVIEILKSLMIDEV